MDPPVSNSVSWGMVDVAPFHKVAENLNDRLASVASPSRPIRQSQRVGARKALSFGVRRQAPPWIFTVPNGVHYSGGTLSLDQSMKELVVDGHLEVKDLRLSEHQAIIIAEGGALVCTEQIQCASMIVHGYLWAPVTTDQLDLYATAEANGLLQTSSVHVVPGSTVGLKALT